MNQYRYDFEGEAIRYYRQTVMEESVQDLDPDGFIADDAMGDDIIDGIDWEDAYLLDDWQDCGENKQRRLLWDSEAESENDDGYRATGSIVRTLQR